MVAQLPRAASAELIDFEQARIKRSISSKQGELPAFAIARLLEESDTHVGDMLANAPIAINPAPRPASENRSLEADRGMREPMTRFLFQDFKRELSQFESRLDEIVSRIDALHEREPQPSASAPQSRLAILPLGENPLAQARPPQRAHLSPPEPVTPPPLLSPTESAGVVTGEAKALPAALARLWRKMRFLVSRGRASAETLAAWLATCARAKAMSRVAGLPEKCKRLRLFVPRATRAKSTLGLGAAGAMVAIGCYHVLIGSTSARMEQASLAVEAARDLPGQLAPAGEIRALPPPARPEIRLNSLETRFAPLDPAPVSSGASAGFAGPAGEMQKTPRPAETAAPVDVAAPPAGNGAAALPAYATAEASLQDETESLASRAERGDADAQYEYATELHDRGDTKGAVPWLEKSAKQGSAKARLQLGLLYLKGAGVTRNFNQARKWLEAAANNGDPIAMHNLGVLYSGNEGRKPDYVGATELFRRAAERGVVDSQFNLGLAYQEGLGVEKDLIQAYAWFCMAASRSDAKAAQKRKEISKFLGREELLEAKTLANSLKLATPAN